MARRIWQCTSCGYSTDASVYAVENCPRCKVAITNAEELAISEQASVSLEAVTPHLYGKFWLSAFVLIGVPVAVLGGGYGSGLFTDEYFNHHLDSLKVLLGATLAISVTASVLTWRWYNRRFYFPKVKKLEARFPKAFE
jgi:hypothetical protein